MPGYPLIVVNVFDAVTVTVTTRCLPGQLVATGDEQLLALPDVDENVPESSAHWHKREADAVTPVMLIALVVVVCIPEMLPLFAGLDEPYSAPARAPLVSSIAV